MSGNKQPSEIRFRDGDFFQRSQNLLIKLFKNDFEKRNIFFNTHHYIYTMIVFSYPYTGLHFLMRSKKSIDFQLDAYYSQIAYSQDFKAQR